MRVNTMMASLNWRPRFRGMTHRRSRPSGHRLPEADYPLQDLTGEIIEAFIHVHHELGYGFLAPPIGKLSLSNFDAAASRSSSWFGITWSTAESRSVSMKQTSWSSDQ